MHAVLLYIRLTIANSDDVLASLLELLKHTDFFFNVLSEMFRFGMGTPAWALNNSFVIMKYSQHWELVLIDKL